MRLDDGARHLIGEPVDIALRLGASPQEQFVACRIGCIAQSRFAAPACLELRGGPMHPADLAEHGGIVLRESLGRATWHLHRGAEVAEVVVAGRFGLNDPGLMRLFAERGMGVAMRALLLVGTAVDACRLVPALGEWAAPEASPMRYRSRSMSDDISTLRRILRQTRTIAVVGLSAQWHRPSVFAAKYMQQHGYRIVPVNPHCDELLGERCYASLADIPHAIDIVDVFRRSEEVLPIAQQAIAIGAKCLWQQIGVVNLEADRLVREAGLDSVLDRCVKIEHARLFGGLHWAGVNTRVISSHRPA